MHMQRTASLFTLASALAALAVGLGPIGAKTAHPTLASDLPKAHSNPSTTAPAAPSRPAAQGQGPTQKQGQGQGQPQDQGQPGPTRREPAKAVTQGGTVVFEAGEHDIVEMLTVTARTLSQRYVFHEDDVATLSHRSINLSEPLRLDREQLQGTIFRLAADRGLVAVAIDRTLGLYEFICIRGTRRDDLEASAPPIAAEDLDPVRHAGQFVACQIELEHLPAHLAANQLRPLTMTGGRGSSVFVGQVGSSLVVIGTGERVHRILQWARAADRKAEAEKSAEEQWRRETELRLTRLEQEAKKPAAKK